jgi:hypothetical protein
VSQSVRKNKKRNRSRKSRRKPLNTALNPRTQRVEEPLARKLQQQLTRFKAIETRVILLLQLITQKRPRETKPQLP